jgi:hypothetical protein
MLSEQILDLPTTSLSSCLAESLSAPGSSKLTASPCGLGGRGRELEVLPEGVVVDMQCLY